MTENELQDLLQRLLVGWENECVEFKEANDNFSTSDIGKYFSALSNEANLRGLPSAWLVFGVNNKTRAITGTDYRKQRDRLHSLKQQIAQGTDPAISFREIYDVISSEGRVLLFEMPAAPRGIPIAWNGHFFARHGESLAALTLAKQDEIRAQSLADDWSAIVCKEATVQLRMIDTMGFGIREIMFRGQANRYLPMPDYDTTGPEHVIMRLQGRFLDENYSRTLLTHADLSWPELLALDNIQKGLATDEESVDSLRRQGFIEGRRPHLHVASHIAAATETEAEYIKHRAFDDRYFCDLILDYLKTFGQGQRTDFERLLTGKLSDLLNDKQKAYKVGRLLQKLRHEGKVRVEGQTRAGIWRLSQP